MPSPTCIEDKPLKVARIRKDFPILQHTVNGKPLVYLDNAATTQKPRVVIDAAGRYYASTNAGVHRGLHTLSVRATRAYEEARIKAQRFLGAGAPEEIVFVRGATEGVNLVAQTYGRLVLKEHDEVVISAMEHHSNIVPWQIVCRQTGATLRVAPINDRGELLLAEYEKLLGARTRLVAVAHVSNALGTVNPVCEIIKIAHRRGVRVLVDGAQAAPHLRIDVRDLDCDFYVLSGHKLFGPTGIGVLYGKTELLEGLPPYQSGGEMIKSVTFEKTTYNDLPHRLEAGTPNVAGAIGLGAAIDYVSRIGLDRITAYERGLLAYAAKRLAAVPNIRLIGTARDKAPILSFVVEGMDVHDVGSILDREGVAVRTGDQCAQPVMRRFRVPGTVRASLALYNTHEEVDALIAGVRKVVEVLG